MRAMPNRHDFSATSHVILIRYQERDHLGHYKGPTPNHSRTAQLWTSWSTKHSATHALRNPPLAVARP